MDLTIKEGDKWPSSFWKRVKWNIPPATTRRSFWWRCSVDFGDCPKGASVKLCGTIEFHPFTFGRNNPFHFAHVDSDRFVATWDGESVSVGAYSYRDGVGAVTGTGKYFDQMMKVGNGESFLIATHITETQTIYWAKQSSKIINYQRDGYGPFRFYSFAHAAGNHGPVAPSDIHISLERI